jgi:putative endonuclease
MSWHVYIIRCRDDLLYTGITKNLERRVRQHNSGNGCRFTRYRTPVELVYCERAASRPRALVREAEIKRLRRCEKVRLFNEVKDA